MPLLRVFPVLGAIVMVFSFTLLVPRTVSWWMQDGAQGARWTAFAITLAMLLGRLAMVSFLVLFSPGFWRK